MKSKKILGLILGLMLLSITAVSWAKDSSFVASDPQWSVAFPDAAWHRQVPPEKNTLFTVVNPTLKIKVILTQPREYLGATKVLTNDIVDYLQDPELNSQAADTKVISHSMVSINHIEYGRIHLFKTSINADIFLWVT